MYMYIYKMTTFKYKDFKIYGYFKLSPARVFLGAPSHLKIRNPIHLNIR